MTEERKLKPTEGEKFWVLPKAINQARFSLMRGNDFEEEVRKIIIASFKAAEENPALMQEFYTFIPKREWDDDEEKTGQDLLDFALEYGTITNVVEQGFEWAQRIENGESWNEVCNQIQKFGSHIVILWEDGSLRYVGSSYSERAKENMQMTNPTYIDAVNLGNSESEFLRTVPKITIRE